ncbi:MAG: YdeI/OmpD-associated family protein [Longimicrobiales bacterium]
MTRKTEPRATFFASPAVFRRWLQRHHATETELWVGFRKRASGLPSITWPESVDQALCFGWIDGLRKSIDADNYKIRFTPRKPKSIWSAINTKRAQELIEQGLMQPAGATVFRNRDVNKSNQYSFEREQVELDAAQSKLFQANRRAWAFFQEQPPSYRRTALWWVISAKQEATRRRRLATLMADSEAGLRLSSMRGRVHE